MKKYIYLYYMFFFYNCVTVSDKIVVRRRKYFALGDVCAVVQPNPRAYAKRKILIAKAVFSL